MTERSRFWNGVATGDATEAPYDASTEFAAVLRSLCGAAGIATNLGGVFDAELNELAVTGATSPVSVASGRALAYGNWYESDGAVAVAIPTPAASTRIDRIVLRKDWTLQTVRITLISGVEGGAAPALVQIAGTTWDTPLAQASITTGGAITLTDQREFIPKANATVHAHSSATDGGAGPLTIADANYYSWLSGNPRLYRDTTDRLALRRGTNPQGFRVYNTDDGTQTDYERVSLHYSSNLARLITEQGGAGSVRNLALGVGNTHQIIFDATGHETPVGDNLQDKGSTSFRFRTGYFGTVMHSAVFSGAGSLVNTNAISQEASGARWIAFGADPTTVGAFRVVLAESDGGGQITSLYGTATSLAIGQFTDITAGGLRVKGTTGAPGADAGTTGSRVVLSGQDSASDLRMYFYAGIAARSYIGHASGAGSLAGVASEDGIDFLFGPANTVRAFFDVSDFGTFVLANHLRIAGVSYIRAGTAFNGQITHSITADRVYTLRDQSGDVVLGRPAVKTADESVSNTITLHSDTQLQILNLFNGGTYKFIIHLKVTEAVANMDFKVALTVPGPGTLRAWATAIGGIGSSGVFAMVEAEMVTSGTGYTLTFANAGATSAWVTISGYCVAAANGTLVFEWAQGSAVVGNLTVESGATMEAFCVS